MMTTLCRFYVPGQGARLGQLIDQAIYDLTASGQPHLATLTAFLRASVTVHVGVLLEAVDWSELPAYPYSELDRAPSPAVAHLLPPVERQEVWAAGVTYAWSREARVREARSKEVYVRVYDAERPEIFFKSLGEKAVGPNGWIGLRGDSRWNVPEPELALVLNPALHVVGYTIGNDASSRDVEGENPLYLPQAKIYRHSCALGPVIALAGESIDSQNLDIHMAIQRGGETVFAGETNTARMHRGLEGLIEYLGLYNDFSRGAVLLTGTGIVPGDDFTLQDGDEVAIEIESIGTLRNRVKRMQPNPWRSQRDQE
jgi:2-dehydro-3-deoxy-D-arabinonate dehydratase